MLLESGLGMSRLRPRKVIRDRDGYYIMLMESVPQDNITVLNVYVLNNRDSKYLRQKLIDQQREIDESIIIVGGLQ